MDDGNFNLGPTLAYCNVGQSVAMVAVPTGDGLVQSEAVEITSNPPHSPQPTTPSAAEFGKFLEV